MRQLGRNGNHLGMYLRQLRLSRGLSIRGLATKINRAPSHLVLIERGRRRVQLFDLWRITDELDGDFVLAVRFLCQDAGIPPEALKSG